MEPEKHHNIPSVNLFPQSYFWLKDYIVLNDNYLISYDSKDYHYLVRVRRFKPGSEFIIRANNRFIRVILKVLEKKKPLILEAKERVHFKEYKNKQMLVMAMIDHTRLDLVIEKLTELGCLELILLKTDYSHTLSDNLYQRKIRHWQAIVEAACMQSGRVTPMSISYELDLKKLYQRFSHLIILDNYQKEGAINLSSWQDYIPIIGPEGGFSDKERQWFGKNNIKSFRVDGNVLRSETMAMTLMGFSLINS